MRKIKARTLWLMVVVELLISVGLIFACIYTKDVLNKVMIVLMVVVFVLMTITIQAATMKSFKFRPKKNYITKEYNNDNDLYNKLEELKFELRERAYGKSYIKIEGKSAFKVVLVSDPNGYFSNDNNDNEEANDKLSEKLDKCNTFTAIEIFLNSNNEIKEKIVDFTIQVDKIYYTALIKNDDNKYVCYNYEKPNDKHEANFNHLLDMLGFSEVKEENEEK